MFTISSQFTATFIFVLKLCCVYTVSSKSCEEGDFEKFQFDDLIQHDIIVYYENSVNDSFIPIPGRRNFVSYFKLDESGSIPPLSLLQSICTSNLALVKTLDKFWELLSLAKNGPTSSNWFIMGKFNSYDDYTLNQTSFNVTKFEMELANQLMDSTFYQQNFLLIYLKLMLENGSAEFVVFTVYRIDTIASPIVIRQIPLTKEFCIFNPINIRYNMASLRPDFFGTELNVIGVNKNWYFYDTKFRNATTANTSELTYEYELGFSVEILFGMKDLLNFRIVARTSDTWGNLDENNKWVGMIGDIMKDKSDLGIRSAANVPIRREVVDFNIPTNPIRISAFFRRTSGFNGKSNAILMPFTNCLWFAIGTWVFFNYICYKLFQANVDNEMGTLTGVPMDWSDCSSRLEVILSVICMKGLTNPPKRTKIRYFYLCEMFVAVILYTAYSAILISFLSVANNPFKSLENLISSDYRFFIMRNPAARTFFEYSSVESHMETYKRSLETEAETPYLNNDQRDFARILLAGKFVYIADHLTAALVRSTMCASDSCEIQEMYIPAAGHRLGSIVKKGSQIRRILDWSILKMLESGNVHLWNQRNLVNVLVPKCDSWTNLVRTDSHVSDLSDVLLVFSILGLTCSVSISILMIEIFRSRVPN